MAPYLEYEGICTIKNANGCKQYLNNIGVL